MQYINELENRILVLNKLELLVGALSVPLESRELLAFIPKSHKVVALIDILVIYHGPALSILKCRQPHPICDLPLHRFETIQNLIMLNEVKPKPIPDNFEVLFLPKHP